MTPIEQVARAAYEHIRKNYLGLPAWEEMGKSQHDTWIGAYRAAIEAMANPTDEMIEAGNTVSGDPASDVVSAIWQAMIAVALRQQEG